MNDSAPDFTPGPKCDATCTEDVCLYKHRVGNTRCLNCSHEQVTVWPGCAESLQCGKCGEFMQVPNPLKPLKESDDDCA